MSENLGEFFSLIGKAKKEKEDEFRSLVGDLDIDSMFSQVKDSIKEDKKKKKKEEKQIKALESWLFTEAQLQEKTKEVEKSPIIGVDETEYEKWIEDEWDEEEVTSEVVEETEEDEVEDTVDHALKILETIKSKEEVRENLEDPEILKIRRELEYLKNLVNAQGGGGEVRLEFLDDVDRDSVKVDGKFLKYQASTGTFIGADASGGGGGSTGAGGTWATGSAGISTTKNVGIGTTAKSGFALDVEGSARITGILTVGKSTITLNPSTDVVTVGTGITLDASNNRILVNGNEVADSRGNAVYSGIITATTFVGSLTGSASSLSGVSSSFLLDYDNFTNTPTIPTNNNQLTNGAGYITTSFTNTNQLTNGAGFITNVVSGVLTATSFIGNGSGITGIVTNLVAGDNISLNNSTGTVTITGLAKTDRINAESLVVSGVATFSSNVTIGGTLTYEDVTNIDSVGLITARNGINVSSGGINVTGIVTATSYDGPGSNLTGIVTGIIAGDNISISRSTGQVTITGLANTANVVADSLQVTGITTLGVVTSVTSIQATTYYGDGSKLTGISAGAGGTENVSSNTTISGIITASEQFYPPTLTTSERDALTVTQGALIFNTTENKVQMYLGSEWKSLAFELDTYTSIGI